MAITASAVWQIQNGATANNANGGFFKTGATGTDYSQQAAAQYNLVSATSAAANAIILHASAAADMVGNGAHVISGTNATPGWYEIISVSVGVSITVDRNWGTGAVASGVVNIGGAISLGSVTANQADSDVAAAVVSGNTVYVKGNVSIASTCTFTAGASLIGYQTTRGDNPTGANRPTITAATFTLSAAGSGSAQVKNLIITGSAANVFTAQGGIHKNLKVINTSTTTTRVAFNAGSANTSVYDCEAISYNGNAFAIGNSCHMFGCYAHDSNNGIVLSGSGTLSLVSNIIESCTTAAINNTGAGITAVATIMNNTLYGSEQKTGIGVNIVSGTTQFHILNNIIYGFATGIADANAAGTNYGDYNLLNNNTANYSSFTAGANDITTTPGLSGVAQIAGTAGSAAGAVLTDAAKSFATVTDGVDFLNVITAAGGTTGQYPIASHTATTVTVTGLMGTAATVVYQITTGRNFKAGANAKAVAFPHAFQAGLTTSYSDLGGVQRDGDTDQPATTDVRSGTTFNNGTKTGSLVGGSKGLGPKRMG